jgi:hypothetical protein
MLPYSVTPLPTLQALLRRALPPADWRITRPSHGQQKECYIAHSHDQAVFLKFDGAPAAIVKRLSDLGIAPTVLASGQLDGRPYVIQDYLTGTHPTDWRWFGEHLPLLAETTQRYQTDARLRQLLAQDRPARDYHAYLEADLTDLAQHLTGLTLNRSLGTELRAALAALRQQATRLQPAVLAPVHGDPNMLNFILTRDQLFLVDWDEIRLSDPLHEIGQWLCWYVDKAQWPVFFTHYGQELDQPLVDRLFWWAARASFANAVWHLSRQYPYEVFVRDCWAALRQRMVPHQVFDGI